MFLRRNFKILKTVLPLGRLSRTKPVKTVSVPHAAKPNTQDIWGVFKDQCRGGFVERLDINNDGPIRPALTISCVKHNVATGGLNQLCTVEN